MYHSKKDKKPQEINYKRVQGYMIWMIERYGDYSAKSLLQKANLLFKEDTQYNQLALDYLIQHEIIDDFRYATRLTNSFAEKNLGVSKIKEKLYLKGFQSKTINDCISELDTSDDDYFEKALMLKVRKFGEEPILDIKLKQKALRHLTSTKGFSFEIANKAINYESDE
jgi:regulatory protein